MSGEWINCAGSHHPPSDRVTPKWARDHRDPKTTLKYANKYGVCAVCSKEVALRSDGTVRVHVNSPEAKRLREAARSQANERAVSDLLKLRQELGSDES